jgi:hypothetical protein
MGHLTSSANRFFETFAATQGRWSLTTPTGVATNGGIVLASPNASAAATLPWYLLGFTAARPLAAGRAAGPGEVMPPLASTPTSLSMATDGTVAFVTRAGTVMTGPSLAGPFRVVTTRAMLASTAAGRRCGLGSITAVAAASGGSPEVGGTCAHSGVDAVFSKVGSTWTIGESGLRAPVSVLRLDATSAGDGAADVLFSLTGSRPTIGTGRIVAGHLRLGATVAVAASSIRSTALDLTAAAPAYVVATSAGRGVAAHFLPVVGRAAMVGAALPSGVQAVVVASAVGEGGQSATAFDVDASTLRVLTLTPAGTRWVTTDVQHIAVPYGSSQ